MTAHTALLTAAAWWYVRHTPPPKLAALTKPDTDLPIIIEAAPKPPPPEQTPPPANQTAPPPPPPPPDFDKAAPAPLHDDSGEATGKGTANRSTPGDAPMQAAQGLEQANLSRSQNDEKSRLDDAPLPAQSGAEIGGYTPLAPVPFGVPHPAAIASAGGDFNPLIAIHDPTRTASPPQPHPNSDMPKTSAQQGSLASPRDTPPSPAATFITPPQEIKGHSTLAGDTDSMAFAKAPGAHFHNGKMDARQGRRVKTTRIDFGLAAQADAYTLGGATVVLGVTVDPTGNVTNVIILRSSGSDNIDLPSQRAVYNWWFEPTKDKDGHTLPDSWVVTID